MKLPGVYGVLATGGGQRREDQNYSLMAGDRSEWEF